MAESFDFSSSIVTSLPLSSATVGALTLSFLPGFVKEKRKEVKMLWICEVKRKRNGNVRASNRFKLLDLFYSFFFFSLNLEFNYNKNASFG